MKRLPFVLTFVLASVALAFAQTGKRPLSLDDLGQLKDVRDPQCPPDGKSVAFVVSHVDAREDKPGRGHIWTIGLDGGNERQITWSTDSESNPRFSPDGKKVHHGQEARGDDDVAAAIAARRRAPAADHGRRPSLRAFFASPPPSRSPEKEL